MKRYILIAAALLFASSSVVQAQEIKPYVGIGLGGFGLEYKEPGVTQKNTILGGFAKIGLDFNEYIGAELRVGLTGKGSQTYPAAMILGAAAATTVDQSLSSFVSYLLKLQYPVASDMRIYGMLGATSAKYKQAYNPGNLVIGAGQSTNKTGFSYGVGGEYFVTDQVSAGFEWMQYWTDVDLGPVSSARVWGATGSLNYHF